MAASSVYPSYEGQEKHRVFAHVLDRVYVLAHLPSGGKIELVMLSTDTTRFMYDNISLRVFPKFHLHHRLQTLPNSEEQTLAMYMTKKNTLVVTVLVKKNNIWIGPQLIRGSYHFACDSKDAKIAIRHIFDDFDGTFRGVVEPYRSGYRYLPPKGYCTLPWVALTGEVHYILARKGQSLADVLIPSDDCELIGMTLVEKRPSERGVI